VQGNHRETGGGEIWADSKMGEWVRFSFLKGIPILILSGVRKVLDLHFKISPDETWMPVKAFLEKPVKPDKLLAEIEKVLGPRE